MSRRKFFAMTGLGSVALGLGVVGWRVGGVWWNQPAAGGMKILSAHEVRIVDSIAEALFPGEKQSMPGRLPSGIEAGCTAFFDQFLSSTLQEDMANSVRLLVHAIDELAIGAVGSRFHRCGLEDRIAVLDGWQSSRFALRRGAFSALKIFLAMGYCENPDVLVAAGIDFTCGDWA